MFKNHSHVIFVTDLDVLGEVKGLSQDTVDRFFDMLEEKMVAAGVKDQPSRIYNLDETGLNTDPKLHKLLCRRGVKDAQAILPGEGKAMYTVLFCGRMIFRN